MSVPETKEMKTLTELLRENFGNPEVVNRFYNLLQERSSLNAVRMWLKQFKHDPVYNLEDCGNNRKRKLENDLLDRLLKDLEWG